MMKDFDQAGATLHDVDPQNVGHIRRVASRRGSPKVGRNRGVALGTSICEHF